MSKPSMTSALFRMKTSRQTRHPDGVPECCKTSNVMSDSSWTSMNLTYTPPPGAAAHDWSCRLVSLQRHWIYADFLFQNRLTPWIMTGEGTQTPAWTRVSHALQQRIRWPGPLMHAPSATYCLACCGSLFTDADRRL